jgi:hypothetical protein
MSSGGISQLVAVGAQDAFLIGDPQVSFFQSAYKHHTNFSQVVDTQVLQGNPTSGGMSTVRFQRNGDMMGFVYITGTFLNSGVPTAYTTQNWSNVIDHVELYIGGQLIDRQSSEFTEFLAPDVFAQNLSKSSVGSVHSGNGTQSYFYPLRFWFCENWQSALPLVALQYHDVEIRIYWSSTLSTNALTGSDLVAPSAIINFEVFTQYIFLDTEERKFMTDKTHTLLINQVQYMSPTNSPNMPIVFNHPIKYLCATPGTASSTSNLTSASNKLLIQINGTDIADFKFACPNFTGVQSYYYAPFSIGNDNAFFLFSFCLDTSKFQPTGTLNFSRLDSVRIISQSGNITNTVYAVNYNILKIQNGMGGLMYSN